MTYFLISYDLKYRRDYEPLWAQLQAWGGEKILQSVWIANLNATAGQVIDALKAIVDSDDALAVIQITSNADWAALRAMTAGVATLKLASP